MIEPPDTSCSAVHANQLPPDFDVQLRERLGDICSLVQRQTGHDFANYKQGTLIRRIRHRIQVSQMESVARYVELLASSAAEGEALLKDLLIGVTQFFRDPGAFDALERVLARLTQYQLPEDPIRIWVPGCATGEEAYTIAILVHEHLERIGNKGLVQLYATDIDIEMLAEARNGRYSASIREHLSEQRLSKYFGNHGDVYQANKDLRDMCLFSQHSLIRDPPFLQLDLISCRNVLIYLGTELQKKVLEVFHYALKPGGCLFLGPSENVTQGTELFQSLDEKSRIYSRKAVGACPVVQLPLSVRTETAERAVPGFQSQTGAKEQMSVAFERTILREHALDVMEPASEPMDLQAVQSKLEQPAVHRLESELLATRAELRSTVEELVSANEELESSNEELISTNEELQSANEELKASREELQSLNEELESVNAQLREKLEELAAAHRMAQLQAQLLHLSHDAIFVRQFDGTIESWNLGAQALYGYGAEEAVGRNSHELLHTQFAEPLADIEAELRSRGAWKGELKHRTKDGRSVLVLSSKQYARGEDGVERILEANRDNTKRAQAERDRELLAQQRQVALDAARLGWWFYEPSTHVARYDQRCREIFGVTDDENENPGLLKLAHPDDLPRVRAAIDAAFDPLDPRPYGVQYRVNRCDGTQVWVEAYGLAEFEGNGATRRVKSFVGTAADITERKQAEESLRRHALVVQQSRDIILFMDRDTGRILEANPAACSAYGYARDELLELSIHDLRAPNTRDSVSNQMKDADSVGILFETWHCRKDGSEFPAEVSARGAATGSSRTLVSVVRDITERHRAESREREQRLQAEQRAAELDTILDALTEPLIVCDVRGEVVKANPAFRRMLGNEDDWKGISASERIRMTKMQTPDGQPLDPRASPGARALAGETVRASLQCLPRQDGSLMHLATSSAPIRTGEGIIGAVIVFSDITDRVRAEQELREVDQRKNEFLAMLSHELRNPLTPIRNSLFLLKNATPGSIQARRAEEVIDRQTTQLVRLVDDLLDITRVSQNKIRLRLHTLNLSDLVKRVVEDHRMLFEERGIVLGFEPCSDPLPVNGDDARLAQVVGNLLSNAAKFTAPGGTVTVKLLEQADRRRAQLRVIDTGAGIEPANLRRLFRPFMQAEVTLDRSEGGLGLGLALVKSLIEAHGGEVCAHSEGLGKGTDFVVELPILASVADEANATEVRAERRARRVLVIEDNLDAAESLRDALEFWAHIVQIAHNGPDGLAMARQFKPEIVLCDIGLPGMDGYELARAFNSDETFKGIYLIALTGYALPDDLERAARAGFNRHLAKPPTLEDLEQVLAGVP